MASQGIAMVFWCDLAWQLQYGCSTWQLQYGGPAA